MCNRGCTLPPPPPPPRPTQSSWAAQNLRQRIFAGSLKSKGGNGIRPVSLLLSPLARYVSCPKFSQAALRPVFTVLLKRLAYCLASKTEWRPPPPPPHYQAKRQRSGERCNMHGVVPSCYENLPSQRHEHTAASPTANLPNEYCYSTFPIQYANWNHYSLHTPLPPHPIPYYPTPTLPLALPQSFRFSKTPACVQVPLAFIPVVCTGSAVPLGKANTVSLTPCFRERGRGRESSGTVRESGCALCQLPVDRHFNPFGPAVDTASLGLSGPAVCSLPESKRACPAAAFFPFLAEPDELCCPHAPNAAFGRSKLGLRCSCVATELALSTRCSNWAASPGAADTPPPGDVGNEGCVCGGGGGEGGTRTNIGTVSK